MNHLRVRAVVSVAAVVLLAGCHRRVKVAALPPPPPAPEMVSVPPPTHPSEPVPAVPLAKVEPIKPELPPSRKKQRHKATPTPAPAPPPPPIVALAQPEPVALGQLTTGGDAENVTLRQQTEDLLHSQQKRLNEVPAAVAATHGQQVEQARIFLRQADEALKKLDVEGARTLATKAKVLLDEVFS